MEIGDLVKLKQPLNFSSNNNNLLGIIVDIHKIVSAENSRKNCIGIEYKVNVVTNNKAAWYFEDSLELVCEGWRLNKE